MNQQTTLITLVILTVVFLYGINYLVIVSKIKSLDTENIIVQNGTVDISTMTLKQKIAQMIIVEGNSFDERFTKMGVGGIYISKGKSPTSMKENIEVWQKNSKTKLFVSADLEGVWSPFSKDFPKEYQFKSFNEIKTKEEAYILGVEHGKVLKAMGFNLNFAPVAEFVDRAYSGTRAFEGDEKEIKEKLKGYIAGLQERVLGTCKHYPGKGMIGNTHRWRDTQKIEEGDLALFDACFDANVSAIMVGHQVVTGKINSLGKPSSVSKEVISTVENKALVISDGLRMLGVRSFYVDRVDMYVDLINSGENVLLEWPISAVSFYKLVSEIEKKVEDGKIDEEKIDRSVRKILEVKGYGVTPS